MFCSKCGKEYVDGQKFCSRCGNQLGAVTGANKQEYVMRQEHTPAHSMSQDHASMQNTSTNMQAPMGQLMPNQTQKKKSLLFFLILGIVALLMICGIIAGVFLLGSNESGDKQSNRYEDGENRDDEDENRDYEDNNRDDEDENSELVMEDTETKDDSLSEEGQDSTADMEATDNENMPSDEAYICDEAEWKAAYLDFLTTNTEVLALLQNNTENVLFYLIYVDDNDVPELYMDSLDGVTGDMMATYYGEVSFMMYIGPYGSCEYVERSGQFANSDGRMGYYSDTYYSVNKGKIEIVSTGIWSEYVNPSNEDEWITDYSWNGQSVDESTYYSYKNEVYPYDRSQWCKATSNALACDELINYLNGSDLPNHVTEGEQFVPQFLQSGTYYNYDLNGDGQPEEVYIEIYDDFEDARGSEIMVYVNEECVIDVFSDYAIGGCVAICDFDFNDLFKEIYVEFYSESDCFVEANAYRYHQAHMQEYFEVSYDDYPVGRWSLDLNMAGDGTVCFDQEYYQTYLGQGYAHRTFSVVNGKLVQNPTHYYDTTADWQLSEYHALIELPLFAEVTSTESLESIEAGECFYVLTLYTESEYSDISNDIRYAYVISTQGKCGWILIPEEEFFEENAWRMWG